MAVALAQTIDPRSLLTSWRGQGWQLQKAVVLQGIPADSSGKLLVPIQLDAFEWIDVQFMGWGNTDSAAQKIRDYIRSGGSELYAYALMSRQDVNALGVTVTSYRLIFCHSLVQLVGAALVILAVAFAAIIFIQYITTGQSPAVNDLKSLWGSSVTAVGQAAGQPIQAIANTYIWATVAAGAGILLLAVASKDFGVKTRAPSGPKVSGGINTGTVRGSVST